MILKLERINYWHKEYRTPFQLISCPSLQPWFSKSLFIFLTFKKDYLIMMMNWLRGKPPFTTTELCVVYFFYSIPMAAQWGSFYLLASVCRSSVWGSAKNVCKQEGFPLKLRERTSLDAERVIPMPRKQVSFHQMKLTGGLDLHLKTARRKQKLTF